MKVRVDALHEGRCGYKSASATVGRASGRLQSVEKGRRRGEKGDALLPLPAIPITIMAVPRGDSLTVVLSAGGASEVGSAMLWEWRGEEKGKMRKGWMSVEATRAAGGGLGGSNGWYCRLLG